eukprot:4260789-Amphidinium_carterae.2
MGSGVSYCYTALRCSHFCSGYAQRQENMLTSLDVVAFGLLYKQEDYPWRAGGSATPTVSGGTARTATPCGVRSCIGAAQSGMCAKHKQSSGLALSRHLNSRSLLRREWADLTEWTRLRAYSGEVMQCECQVWRTLVDAASPPGGRHLCAACEGPVRARPCPVPTVYLEVGVRVGTFKDEVEVGAATIETMVRARSLD